MGGTVKVGLCKKIEEMVFFLECAVVVFGRSKEGSGKMDASSVSSRRSGQLG